MKENACSHCFKGDYRAPGGSIKQMLCTRCVKDQLFVGTLNGILNEAKDARILASARHTQTSADAREILNHLSTISSCMSDRHSVMVHEIEALNSRIDDLVGLICALSASPPQSHPSEHSFTAKYFIPCDTVTVIAPGVSIRHSYLRNIEVEVIREP